MHRTTTQLCVGMTLLAAVAMMLAANPAQAADASAEVAELRNDFVGEAAKAREEYRKQLTRYARTAVSKLEKVAADAVRSGDLAGATLAMREILRLDRDNTKAVAHFKAIGQLDAVLEELKDEPVVPESAGSADTGKLGQAMAGTVWSWGDNRTIAFTPNGRATVSDDPKPNTRIWWVAPTGDVHLFTNTLAFYEILKFDPNAGTYKGVVFKMQVNNKTGKRVR